MEGIVVQMPVHKERTGYGLVLAGNRAYWAVAGKSGVSDIRAVWTETNGESRERRTLPVLLSVSEVGANNLL
jgi:hypothetical protein